MNITKFSRRAFLAVGAATVAGSLFAVRRAVATRPPVRVGVIGFGIHGRDLIDRIQSSHKGAANVVAISDSHVSRAVTSNTPFATFVDDWRDLMARPDIDAVIIATPDDWHAAMTQAAIEAGKDVYCASPMARTVAKAEAVRDAVNASGCVYQVGADLVLGPQWQAARALIESSVIGSLRWCSVSAGTKIVHRSWEHYGEHSNGPGANLVHDWAAAMAMVTGIGDGIHVTALGGRFCDVEGDVPDGLHVSIQAQTGPRLAITASPNARLEPRVLIRGEAGSMLLDRFGIWCGGTNCADADLAPIWQHDVEQPRTALAEWFDCIHTRERCTFNADLGLLAASVASLAVDSWRAAASFSEIAFA